MKFFSFLIFYISIIPPIYSITGYVRYTETSICMNECSIYYLEDENGEFLTWITHLDDVDMLSIYTDRFVELDGPEVFCVECWAIDVTLIEISDECEFPVDCFADPCTIQFCQDFPEAECIPNYCEGCWADYYLDGQLLNCDIGTDCIDLSGIDFGDCDMFLGVGWINDNCEYVSGCDWVAEEIDYSSAFFSSIEECLNTCESSTPSEIVTYSIQEGWNLIGLPLEVENSSFEFLFPNAVEGTLYSFNDGYNSEENLSPGDGYWLRFQIDDLFEVSGNHIDVLTIYLSQGWNLISGLNQIANIETVIDEDNIIVPGTFYGFENEYHQISQLSPGKGYWVRASQLGVVHINFE